MTSERRKHPRFSRPIDGSWRGASGGSSCRISDLSLGGCFVQGMAAPAIGEETVVTIAPSPDQSIAIKGRVVYIDRGMGFAVQFHDLPPDVHAQLLAALQSLGTGTP